MKKIIHIDADCFYASVEMHENPEFRNVPLAIGGAANKRGVIATCNYDARKFGVKSAMPSAKALKLCPFLQLIPPRIALYREYSHAMREIFLDYTSLIEPLSLDEAYLDVSNSNQCKGSGTLIAEEIRARIFHEVGISVSAGVAPVKFLAKIASDWRKPNGIFVVEPDFVTEFVQDLPVKLLPGVGPVTAEKMAKKGILTCKDLKKRGLHELIAQFGVFGGKLYQMSHGKDDRDVISRSERKSISVERTFEQDVGKREELLPHLDVLLHSLFERIESANATEKIAKAFVKLKFSDFSQTTMETSLANGCADVNLHTFQGLINAAQQRKVLPLRLVGVGVRLKSASAAQLHLDID
ncbi:MAG: DNA polymerase IV [Agarilytica sp.]